MKTLLLSLLCLFVWSQSTEALTDQQVVLGQSVTLTCEFRLKAVVWFVMKQPAHPEMILRTFGDKPCKYYDEKLREKYSEGDRSQLVINNVSGDDLGIYYCVQPGCDLKISEGIRLHTAESPRKYSETDQTKPSQDQTTIQIPIIILSLLTVVLFTAVIGLLIMNCKLSKKIPKYVNAHQMYAMFHKRNRETTDPDYVEVLPNI